MTDVKIITNNIPRDIKYGWQMPAKHFPDFDYIGEWESEEFQYHQFFEYKGQWYDLGGFMRIDGAMFGALNEWHGYQSDSYFSGIVIRYCNDYESVIVGRYSC